MSDEAVKLIIGLLIANSAALGGIWLKVGGFTEAIRGLRTRLDRLEAWQDGYVQRDQGGKT